MSPSVANKSSLGLLGRRVCGASLDIHQNTFRGLPLALPNSQHRVQMKFSHGVELLLVHLAGEEDAYCSLRYLEATLGQPDLVAFMKHLGINLKTRTVKDVSILTDIINLRSGILENEPVLIAWKAAECILKHVGLAFTTPDAEMKTEESESRSTVEAKAGESDS